MNTMNGKNSEFSRLHCSVASEIIMMILGMDNLPLEAVEHLQCALEITDNAVGNGYALHIFHYENGDIESFVKPFV